MASLPRRMVADLGNSRLKLAWLDDAGQLRGHLAITLDEAGAWVQTLQDLDRHADDHWAIGSVNPPKSAELARIIPAIDWFRSAADVPVPQRLRHPERTGADRALAVVAARGMTPRDRPTLVVLCGTAITVERIDPGGIWEGGAIAPGLGLMAEVLSRRTAQLPRIVIDVTPPSWGDWTEPALAAGVFWGTVGAVRELIARQAREFALAPSVVWCGGDAERLASHVEAAPQIVPDLVLRGVAQVAFGDPVG